MSKRRGSESAREEAERLDRLHDEGDLDRLPYVRLRPYAKEASQVYAIRIPVSRLHEIRSLAEARGEQPTSLLREWVLERLDSELAVSVGEGLVDTNFPVAAASLRPKSLKPSRGVRRGGRKSSTDLAPKTRRS